VRLLDTNVISDIARGIPAVRARLLAESPRHLATSATTLMELEFGLALDPARARRIRPAVEALLDSIAVDLTPADARAAATVRAALKRRGRPVGPYDILIAGVALARGLSS
jgi:tRNA(fMet)-specific endonuclease VapC